MSKYMNYSNPDSIIYMLKLFHTTDSGKTFDTIFLKKYNFSSIYFSDGTHGFMVGGTKDNSLISRTEDGGKSWTDIPVPFKTILRKITFINKKLGFITGDMDTLLYTTDGGQNWLYQRVSEDTTSLPPFYITVKAVNDSTIFLLGRKRFIRCIIPKELRTSAVEEPKVAEGTFNPYFYIKTNPVPALSTINVTLYGLYSVKNKPLTVKVYDVLGYEVADFSREANAANNGSTSTFRADVGQLGAGVYILQYSAGGYSKSGLFMVGR